MSIAEAEVDGKVLFVGFIHDITEQKRLEKELIQHRDHLGTLVTQRTEELSLT